MKARPRVPLSHRVPLSPQAELVAVEVNAKLVKSAAKRMVEAYANLVKSAKPTLRFHRELLHMPWLSPRICRAIKADICGSVREYDRQIKRNEAVALRLLVDAAKARMRKNGERPRGGIEAAALDEVAEQQDLPSGDALRKRLQRHE
jgi:hypothetical protein